jgi:hypothetical protein
VKLTVQAPPVKEQLLALNEPVPVKVNITVPVGVMIVPGDVSETVTLQLDAWLITTGVAQETAVAEVRTVTVIEAAALVLVEWPESPPYVPVTVAEPAAEPVKLTLHAARRVEPATVAREQLAALRVPEPVDVNVTVPVGGVGEVAVSLTVAVQAEAWLITTGEAQATFVFVAWTGGIPNEPSTFVVTMVTPLLTMFVFWRWIFVNPLGLTTA